MIPERAVRFVDSYASLLVLLLANFFLIELVDSRRWGAIGSTLLAAVALVVAISDRETGHTVRPRHWLLVGVCAALAAFVLFFDSARVIGLAYLLPALLPRDRDASDHELRDGPFFAQPGEHPQSEFVYFSFVTLTTLGFGDLSPAQGLPQAPSCSRPCSGRSFS